jgi:NAD-dependent DNA ligase
MCRCLIQGKHYEEEKHRTAATRTLLDRIDQGQIRDIPSMILDHNIMPEHPDIHFHDAIFLFTGKMAWGPRSKAEELVLELGGQLAKSKSVTDELDYLVLGEDQEQGWMGRLSGNKLTQAVRKKIASPNGKLQIILETDFIAAINKLREAD